MPKIETEKIDCLYRRCSRPAPRGKIESVRTHSEIIEQFDSFSLLKLLFLVRKWHCGSRKAFPRQMTPQSREKTAKTAVFRHRWQAWKVVRSIAAVRQRPRTPRNRRCSFAFFETFLWHFNKKQRAAVIFRLSRPVSCKNQENGSGKRWSLHAPLKIVLPRWRGRGNRHLPRTCWRDPRRHITAERRSEKITRHRSHPMTAEYGIASFAARREARRLNVTRADGPKPPDAAKTGGVKEAISTSRTRWSYRRRLCCSWRRKTEAVERRASFERARGLKTRTSKNAHSNVPPHKPRALTSSRASGSRLALECRKTSPLRGCSLGSTSTSVQTSLKSEAVRSRISLCRAMVNPPLLHVRPWQLSNGSPHAQCEGRLVGSQPYRRAMASRNAPLCRANPSSWRGRAESQDEAPSSMARSTAESRGGDSWFRMARCACFSSSALSFFALVIATHKHGHSHIHTHFFSEEAKLAKRREKNYRHTHTNLPLVLVVSHCIVLAATWSNAGITCRACHSSGASFHCDTHTHTFFSCIFILREVPSSRLRPRLLLLSPVVALCEEHDSPSRRLIFWVSLSWWIRTPKKEIPYWLTRRPG